MTDGILHKPKRIVFNGKTQTLREWATETGLSLSCISSRVGYGWAPHEILTRPALGKNPIATKNKRRIATDLAEENKRLRDALFTIKIASACSSSRDVARAALQAKT